MPPCSVSGRFQRPTFDHGGDESVSVDAIEKALGEFKLIKGAGSEASKEACATTLLAWVKGEDWTDHPSCMHSIIADNLIAANDAPRTTIEQQAELVRAGRMGALDTWWVPSEVIAFALALREGGSSDAYERTMRLLAAVTEWKASDDRERPVLRGAVLRGADLSDAILRGAGLRGADLRGAVGVPRSDMPSGWRVESGLWVLDVQ
jgi:Uncharacterized low-complexity proteins